MKTLITWTTFTLVFFALIVFAGCADQIMVDDIDDGLRDVDEEAIEEDGIAYPTMSKMGLGEICAPPENHVVFLAGQSNAKQKRDPESWPRAMDSLAAWSGNIVDWSRWNRGSTGLIPGTSKHPERDWYIDNPEPGASYKMFREKLDDRMSKYSNPDSIPLDIPWIQGGRDIQVYDGAKGSSEVEVTEDKYYYELKRLVEDIKADYPLMNFWIVQEAHHLYMKHGESGPMHDTEGARVIRRAQQRLADDLPYVHVAFRQIQIRAEDSSTLDEISGKYVYELSADGWHYTSAGYDLMNLGTVRSIYSFWQTGTHTDPPYPTGYSE